MFLHPSVSHSVHGGRSTPRGQTQPPRQTLPGRHPPWADTPRSDTPAPPPRDGHCSGRFASYFNAFLFLTETFQDTLMLILYKHEISDLCYLRKQEQDLKNSIDLLKGEQKKLK